MIELILIILGSICIGAGASSVKVGLGVGLISIIIWLEI